MVDINTARRSGKPRQGRMPKVVELAVALLKAEERKALLQAIDNPDPALAEMAKVVAVTMDRAATLVLHAFDETTRKPSI